MNQLSNNSPWLHELDHDREAKLLAQDIEADVVIIGGGISGLATAYFTLKDTDRKVTLIEGSRLAHGATGHNAGQVVDYFEKFFTEMVDEYGLELAAAGQNAVISAWDLLEEIISETKLDIPYSKFVGYAGCTNYAQLKLHFDNKLLKVKGGVPIHKSRVADTFAEATKIDKKYAALYEVVPHQEILDLLETDDPKFIAALQSQKGVLNSALFVEKLANYLLNTYSNRFEIFEHTMIHHIELDKDKAILTNSHHSIICNQVVLCTNGFENIHITNKAGKDIDKTFHDMVYSIVGFMAGYIEDRSKDPIAISYFAQRKEPTPADPYFYLTRRDHKHRGENKNLIVIGGPEQIKDREGYKYLNTRKYPKVAGYQIFSFLNKSFKHKPTALQDFDFKWHGLMGYTKSGIRTVGTEPLNEILMYNLGCNGIGILPSIYGGSKIAKHIAGQVIADSIFDPHVQRSVLGKR